MVRGANERGGMRRGRILVIDDEPLVTGALARFLEVEHDVDTAHGARVALALLDAGRGYDMILCDVLMPGMDGLVFYQAERREHPGQADRIVFMTGGMLLASTRKLLGSVPNRVIEKPFDQAALLALAGARVAEQVAREQREGRDASETA